MTIGVENFEAKWSSVENYVSGFFSQDLDPAGFERKHLASLDLMTNIRTPDLSFSVPNPGRQIVMRVETQTGAGITPSTISLQYVNQDTNTVSTGTVIGEGVPAKHDTVIPFNNTDTGIYSLMFVTNVGPPRSGVVGIYAPSFVAENFEGTWGAADIGL